MLKETNKHSLLTESSKKEQNELTDQLKTDFKDAQVDLQLHEFNLNMLKTGSKETFDSPREHKSLPREIDSQLSHQIELLKEKRAQLANKQADEDGCCYQLCSIF